MQRFENKKIENKTEKPVTESIEKKKSLLDIIKEKAHKISEIFFSTVTEAKSNFEAMSAGGFEDKARALEEELIPISKKAVELEVNFNKKVEALNKDSKSEKNSAESTEKDKEEAINTAKQKIKNYYRKKVEILNNSKLGNEGASISGLKITEEEFSRILRESNQASDGIVQYVEEKMKNVSSENLDSAIFELNLATNEFQADENTIIQKIKKEIILTRAERSIKDSKEEMAHIALEFQRKISLKQDELFSNGKIDEAIRMKDIWRNFDMLRNGMETLGTGSEETGTLTKERADMIKDFKQEIILLISESNKLLSQFDANSSEDQINKNMLSLNDLSEKIIEMLSKVKI
jgi:hypothetical protein